MYNLFPEMKMPGDSLYRFLNKIETENGIKSRVARTGSIYLTFPDEAVARIADHDGLILGEVPDFDIRSKSTGTRDRILGVKLAISAWRQV